MENASKALIIAGAILLAIVIISLGLIVVNNVRNVTDNTNLSEQEIQSFNAKFTSYEGTSVAGSRVNSLIQQVIATNQSTIESGNTNVVVIGYQPINYVSLNSYVWVTTNNNKNIVYAAHTAGEKLKFENFQFPNSGNPVIAKSITKSVSGSTGNPPQLSTETGKTYTVKIKYDNGLVSIIACIPN